VAHSSGLQLLKLALQFQPPSDVTFEAFLAHGHTNLVR
jgi:hypothetical protein